MNDERRPDASPAPARLGAPMDASAEERLDARLAGLREEVPVSPELWSRIAAELDPPRAKGRPRAFAGLGVAAAVATLAIVLALPEGGGPAAPETAAVPAEDRGAPEATAVRPRELPASGPGGTSLGAGFLQVRAEIGVAYEQRLTSLDPATREVVETNLAVIHAAIDRIETALEADPGNVVLRDLLRSSLERELDYMGRITRMPRAEERRMEL